MEILSRQPALQVWTANAVRKAERQDVAAAA
jgi:hypothetical protein